MTMSSDAQFGTEAFAVSDSLDPKAVDRWMRLHIDGYSGQDLNISKFKGGQSNPTYQVYTTDRTYVLRKKPAGKLLRSAHAVDREFKAISALYNRGFPVPKPFGMCNDDAVIGSSFYVMQMMEGSIFWDQTLPALPRDARSKVYKSEIETLARLHSFDPIDLGLGDFGRPGNYFARQVDRWTKQYRLSQNETNDDIERLIEWLPETVPQQERTSIVHGDYRLDNMVFESSGWNVVAVLDWELSTIGDPLADLTYLLLQWILKDTKRLGLVQADLISLNIPTITEALDIYRQASGWHDLPDLNWYLAYNLFRLACILQGIVGRVKEGTASSAAAADTASRIAPIASMAWYYARMAGAI
jgi:aminoglycoside phosphotransferase (APT) family kinase protein